MGLFNFGKKQNQEKAGVRKIDLKSILSEEEIRYLEEPYTAHEIVGVLAQRPWMKQAE